MRLTIHIKKPYFITKEQKETKVTNSETKKVSIIRKPKKPECIVNTLTFKDLFSWDLIEEVLVGIRSKHGIRVDKNNKEMYQIHPKVSTNLPNLDPVLKRHLVRTRED